jgi:hypothetical protein
MWIVTPCEYIPNFLGNLCLHFQGNELLGTVQSSPPGNHKGDVSGGHVLGLGEMRNANKISADKPHTRVHVGDPVGGKVITLQWLVHTLFAAMIWPELDEKRDI